MTPAQIESWVLGTLEEWLPGYTDFEKIEGQSKIVHVADETDDPNVMCIAVYDPGSYYLKGEYRITINVEKK